MVSVVSGNGILMRSLNLLCVVFNICISRCRNTVRFMCQSSSSGAAVAGTYYVRFCSPDRGHCVSRCNSSFLSWLARDVSRIFRVGCMCAHIGGDSVSFTL